MATASADTSARSRATLSLDGSFVAGYRLDRRLAVGGMSEVYLARPLEGEAPASHVVIKRLMSDRAEDPEQREAFITEARLHSALRHVNIVEVYEWGDLPDGPYIAMEYVPGVDLFRLMRHLSLDDRAVPPAIAAFIGMELCKALTCAHDARDEFGTPLKIVHRDVTPSNVYVSETGDVKLGDFGIARAHSGGEPAPGASIKGKYGYLSPEQVNAEPFDHRSDQFSLAVVISELMLGEPLFSGAGQLAVLLAIRDVRIDNLRAAAEALPPGMFDVLNRALCRNPEGRFTSASEFGRALAQFVTPTAASLRDALSVHIQEARASTSIRRRIEQIATRRRSSQTGMAAVSAPQNDVLAADVAVTASVRTRGGEDEHGVAFSKLAELITTGQLGPQDEVDMGDGFMRVIEVGELARYMPHSTGTTTRISGPGVPDYVVELFTEVDDQQGAGPASSGATTGVPMLDLLRWVLNGSESGVFFAEQAGTGRPNRKELYFEGGRLIAAVSSDSRELLGERLVANGVLDRGELEMALLVLPKYDGRLGEALIALGLCESMQLFQAIRDQGRDRVGDLFQWSEGRMSFYRGVRPSALEFRLDIDVPTLMLAGMHIGVSGADLITRWAGRMSDPLRPITPMPTHLSGVVWPPLISAMLMAIGEGSPAGEALEKVSRVENVGFDEALRALEISLAIGVVGLSA